MFYEQFEFAFVKNIGLLIIASLFLSACGGGGSSSTQAPSLWTKQQSGFNSTNLLAITKGAGSNVVAVGSGGIILTSSDGITWSQQTSGTTNDLNGIVWSGTKFVAVGSVGTVLTSIDGVTWISQTSGITDTLNAVSWNGSGFVAVGGNTVAGISISSNDGITWFNKATLASKMLRGVAWNGSKFIVVGDGGSVYTTPNGSIWTLSGGSDADNITAVTTNGNGRVVWVRTSGRIYYTTDLITWTSNTPPTSLPFYGVCWDGGKFIAVGANSMIFVSTDGSIWKNQLIISGGNRLNGVVWNGNILIAIGNNGEIFTSP